MIQQSPVQRRRGGLGGCLGASLLMMAALAAIVWWWRSPAPKGPDTPALLAQVRQLNQLATVRYTVQKVVGLEEAKYPVGSERILLVVQAVVEAGVNLESLGPDSIERQGDGTVIVRLPPAEILSASLNEKETRVWDRQKTWWTPWVPYSTELEKKARLEGLEAARKAALEMGILKQAERNAESSIRSLLRLAGVEKVTIIPSSVS